MYRCNPCKRYFIEEKDFQKLKGNAKVTTVILDLYFKGISLRKICDHLNQFYDLEIIGHMLRSITGKVVVGGKEVLKESDNIR